MELGIRGEEFLKKKLGIGSLSLLLAFIAILWSMDFPVHYDTFCIGDYVLTGGEIPACILIDAVARTCKGVLSDNICFEEESIASGLLEYPQYTRPVTYKGESVPEVLLGGNHAEIERWRRMKALEITAKNRPDLL